MNVVLIIILFLFMPILIIGILVIVEERRKRKINGALEEFVDQLVKENGILLLDYEYFFNRVIGLDRKNKKLLFAVHREGVVDSWCFGIDGLIGCKIKETIEEPTKQVKQVFLELKCKGVNRRFHLLFFDGDFDYVQTRPLLLQKAKTWMNKINLATKPMFLSPSYEYVL